MKSLRAESANKQYERTGVSFPFAAIVGQDEMKLALTLSVIAPSIGGVLIMGHRGTGKSTAVRALAELLPPVWVVRGCSFNCDPSEEAEHCAECSARLQKDGKLARERKRVPVVDLPLGATEDRVTGSINIERALTSGTKAFEPGLLARAHRGFLYIDEVNLLEDHLVDLLLDASVTGRNVVEREGVSVEHPAQFVLVGSGNPEEGELRPQLQDRFGLSVEVTTPEDVGDRVRVLELMEEFGRDAESFRLKFEKEQERLRKRITRARERFQTVLVASKILRAVAELCQRLGVHGHRGEITIVRAARALAAFEGRVEATESDVRRVAPMSLRHRLRRDPLERTGGGSSRVEDEMKSAFHDSEREGGAKNKSVGSSVKDESAPIEPFDGDFSEKSFDNGFRVRPKKSSVRKSRSRSEARQKVDDWRGGRFARAVARRPAHPRVALAATVQAFANSFIEAGAGRVTASALRYKQFRRKAGTLFIFAVDASGSMASNRIRQAKGALLKLLEKSYVARDSVALVSFRGVNADVIFGPSRSMTRARDVLDALPVGGATPLCAGLQESLKIACEASRRGASRIVLLLFTDGRGNVPLRATNKTATYAECKPLIDEEVCEFGSALRRAGVSVVVVDTDRKFVKNSEAKNLAGRLDARYVQLPALNYKEEF